MINNRQAGRRRGRGGQQQRSQGNPGRQDNGNRIDNRARGNAAQLLEKYKSLAADAQRSGDRVNTEYYLQFADHYFRVLAETRARFEENRQQHGGPAYQDDEQEYDEDGEPVARPERQARPQNERQDRGNQDRGNDGERDRDAQREDRPRRFNGNGGSNGYDQQTERQPYQDRGGSARQDGEREGRDNRAEHYDAEGPAGVEGEVVSEQPRHRGRPRREESSETAARFDAGSLPPSLGISAVNVAEDAPAGEEKPRRRRRLSSDETPAAS